MLHQQFCSAQSSFNIRSTVDALLSLGNKCFIVICRYVMNVTNIYDMQKEYILHERAVITGISEHI